MLQNKHVLYTTSQYHSLPKHILKVDVISQNPPTKTYRKATKHFPVEL